MLKFTSYRIFMPIKLKCNEHSGKAIKTDKQSHLTDFAHEKLFAVTFLVISFRKLKWHQDQAHEEDRTRYSECISYLRVQEEHQRPQQQA